MFEAVLFGIGKLLVYCNKNLLSHETMNKSMASGSGVVLLFLLFLFLFCRIIVTLCNKKRFLMRMMFDTATILLLRCEYASMCFQTYVI